MGTTRSQPVHIPVLTHKMAPATVLHGLTWIGEGSAITIEDLRIVDPMAYFVDSTTCAKWDEPAAIDVAQTFSGGMVDPGRLSYWPRYVDLGVQQRRYYLRWLADGRRVVPAELGYAFLFFYGLERRALIDQADDLLIFEEVMRLRRLYRDSGQAVSRSWDSYSSSFLWFLHVVRPDNFTIAHVQRLTDDIEIPHEDHVAALQCWFAATKTWLPGWAAFLIAQSLPDSARSVVQRRVAIQFKKLFMTRYAEQFGAGIELRCAKNERAYPYRSASAIFRSVSVNQINPSGIRSQYKPLARIWNDCTDELKKLSTVVGKQGAREITVAAWEAMPVDLREGIDHPLIDKMCQLLGQADVVDGITILPAGQLASALEIGNGITLTPAQGRRLCEIADQIGYSIEPDAHFTAKGYAADQSVAVLLKTTDEAVDAGRYLAATCMLHVGIVAALSDDRSKNTDLSPIMKNIESAFQLNEAEHRRLDALRVLASLRGPDLALIAKIAKGLNAERREAIGKLALAIVAADGVVTPSERKALRTCYTKLGFSRDEIDRVIHSVQETSQDDPVTVAIGATSVPGETIPYPPVDKLDEGLRLDRAAIAAIMQDTNEVANLLAAAMSSSEDHGDTITPSDVTAVVATVAQAPDGHEHCLAQVTAAADLSIPARYANFYDALIAQTKWSLKDAEALARAHGHMLSGAIEALNEWSTDKYGGQLFFEDGETLAIETTLLN